MEAYYIGIDMEGAACVVGTPGEGLSYEAPTRRLPRGKCCRRPTRRRAPCLIAVRSA